MIEIVSAPPFLAVQDLGRPGYRAQGVPAGGAMDRWALSVANVLAGNPPESAALEWALGGGALRVERPVVLALAGATVDATLDGAPLAMHTAYRAPAGSVLVLHRLVSGRFVYLAFEGGIDVPAVLGSRATYLPARFGGLGGRLLRPGDRLPLGAPVARVPRAGYVAPPELLPSYESRSCGVLRGPHDTQRFGTAAWSTLVSEPFRIERSSDRTGYRLHGPSLANVAVRALPSEPMCPGAMQVATGGQAIVLMPDGPTVGGYPVIAVLGTVDLLILAQREPGEEVRFVETSLAEARREVLQMEVAIRTLANRAMSG